MMRPYEMKYYDEKYIEKEIRAQKEVLEQVSDKLCDLLNELHIPNSQDNKRIRELEKELSLKETEVKDLSKLCNALLTVMKDIGYKITTADYLERSFVFHKEGIDMTPGRYITVPIPSSVLTLYDFLKEGNK